MSAKASRLQVRQRLLASFGALILASASAASAAEPPSRPPATPSKEMREKMAAIHEQLAACLRSDKPIADCRKEAMKNHQEMVGKGGCPMMDMDHVTHKQVGKTDEKK
jgi:hypothetical protein